MFVKAVHMYNGRYYYVPSSFSDEGTLDPDREWKLLEKKPSYEISTLTRKKCEEICPGYLD